VLKVFSNHENAVEYVNNYIKKDKNHKWKKKDERCEWNCGYEYIDVQEYKLKYFFFKFKKK